MAISLSVLCVTILVAFEIYRDVIGDVTATLDGVDAVSMFYKSVGLKELLEEFR